MKNPKEIKLWTALVTPLNNEGKVDYVTLQSLVERQAREGLGILLLGSTGEGLNLNDEERIDIIHFCCNLDVNVPLMVGIGGVQMERQLKWLDFLNQQNVDALLMVAPLYAKAGPLGSYSWFKTLLDRAQKPVMLYNVPSRTGTNIPYETIERLHKHPNLYAFKEASGDIERYKEYDRLTGNMLMFSGEDGVLPELAALGAYGLVSVVSNVWPEATRKYLDLSLSGHLDTSSNLLWKEVVNAIFEVASPVPVKHLMFNKGLIATPYTRLPLSCDDLQSVERLIQADEKINDWLNNINI